MPGISRTCTSVRVERLDELGRLARGRGRRRASSAAPGGLTTSTRSESRARQRSATAAACSKAHAGRHSSAASRPASDEARPPARVEAGSTGLRARSCRRARTRPARSSSEPRPAGARGRRRRARRSSPARRATSGPETVRKSSPAASTGIAPTDCAPSTSTGIPVSSPQLAHGQHPPGRPEHLGQREQARSRGDRGADRVGLGRDDDDPRAGDARARRAGRNARRSS